MNGREASSGKYLPGVSGNPSGRPSGSKGLAAYINAQTSDGHEITDFMLSVMRGEAVVNKLMFHWNTVDVHPVNTKRNPCPMRPGGRREGQ